MPAIDPNEARVWLLDASLYIFRAWQSSPPVHDAEGRQAHAVRGFAAWLVELLAGIPPAAPLLCAFDSHDGQGLRRELDADYKAGRPPIPPELFEQIERCREVAGALGLAVRTGGALEADDLIGHFATLAHAQVRPVTVVSGDKDLAQYLATDHDRWWDAGRRDPLDLRAVTRRFGVCPAQIPDWLALAGDESDGIRGVPGVGPPTAARLLKRFGDLDTLFARASEVASMRFRGAPHVATLLPEHEARVRAARRLTGPLHDPALPASLDAIARRLPDVHEAAATLAMLGLEPDEARRSAARALAGPSASAALDGAHPAPAG